MTITNNQLDELEKLMSFALETDAHRHVLTAWEDEIESKLPVLIAEVRRLRTRYAELEKRYNENSIALEGAIERSSTPMSLARVLDAERERDIARARNAELEDYVVRMRGAPQRLAEAMKNADSPLHYAIEEGAYDFAIYGEGGAL